MYAYCTALRCKRRLLTRNSDELSEGRAPPAPGAVVDKVGRLGGERSVVSVELARLVTSMVVVRVTDRPQVSVELARL